MPMIMLQKVHPKQEFVLVDFYNNLVRHEGCNCVLGPVEGSFREILSVDDVPRHRTAPKNFLEWDVPWKAPAPQQIYIGDSLYWSEARLVAEGEFDKWQKLYEVSGSLQVYSLWTRVPYEYALQRVIADAALSRKMGSRQLENAFAQLQSAQECVDQARGLLQKYQQIEEKLEQLDH